MSEGNANQHGFSAGASAEVPVYMRRTITTREAAEDFIRALHADGRLFHFDDSPETIVNLNTGSHIFTHAECESVRARVGEMRDLAGFDPFDLAVELI